MDPDTLRLILIVAGGFFLVGMYLWERRRAGPKKGASRVKRRGAGQDKSEPRLGAWFGDEQDIRRDDADPAPGAPDVAAAAEQQPEPGLEPVPEAEQVPPSGALIVVLNITPAAGPFQGKSIVQAASHCGLEPGPMDIFHRYRDGESGADPTPESWFSMANMVNPGTFSFGGMATFESPGLTLFCQTKGEADDAERLDDMFATAHCLAAELNGLIRDEKRNLLTPEVEQRLRDRVLTHASEHPPDGPQE